MLKRLLTTGSFLFICCFSNPGFGQLTLSEDDRMELVAMEDTLVGLADSMYNAFIPDQRPGYCEKFVKHLVRSLKIPNSWTYDFPKLKEVINIIAPDDNAFRIFNWQIIPQPNQVRYYGAVQLPAEELKLYPLIDYSHELTSGLEDSILTNTRWYGALYYRIHTHELEGNKIYTLFGLNAAGLVSNKKVLDPMRFTENGLVFGAPVFNYSSESNPAVSVKRFVMEYKKDVSASLNWDKDLNMIYFDRLASQMNDPNRKYTFAPTGQYDGFRLYQGKWTFVRDLIPIQNFKDGEAPAPKAFK